MPRIVHSLLRGPFDDQSSRPKLLFLILMLLLFVQSCVQTKNSMSPKSHVQPVAHAKHLIDAGEYQKAIDAYNVEYQKHPQDQTLVREYMSASRI